jgi:hypothetical protein
MAGEYQEIETLWDAGVGARITMRVNPNGLREFSYQFVRPYKDREGERRETHWFSRRHLAALLRLIAEVNERILAEKERYSRADVA